MDYTIGIYILFHGKCDQTIECIKSFLPSGLKIYVLNNGSRSQERECLGDFCGQFSQITIFDSADNLGVSAGRNYLIGKTSEEWMFFVDNDIVVKTKDWVAPFNEYLNSNPEIEIFIPKMFDKSRNCYEKNYALKAQNVEFFHEEASDKFTNLFPGGAALINRKVFSGHGPYDEEIFVGYEDYELCIRALLGGNELRCCFIPEIELLHDHQQPKTLEDKVATLIRYSPTVNNSSIQHINAKYPGYKFPYNLNWSNDMMSSLFCGEYFYDNKKLKQEVRELRQYKVELEKIKESRTYLLVRKILGFRKMLLSVFLSLGNDRKKE